MNEKLIRSLKQNPVKYAHLLGFDKLIDLHNGWIRSMITSKVDYTLLAHRGSYKTTCFSIAMWLLIILRPNKTIFFIRKTDDDVIEIVNQVRKLLESDLSKYIVQQIYGVELLLTTSSAYKIDTNLNNGNFGQVQMHGMGLNGSITGKHADYIFVDDISTLKDRVSKAERDQTIRQYQELQNVRNRGGRIVGIGTPWHPDDVVSAKNKDGSPKYMKNQHCWTVYDTGLISKEKQQELRDSMTPSLYAANYELKHIADADSLFTAPNWLEDTEENNKLIYGGVAHCDAAYNGSDYTAYTIFHKLKDGRIIGYGNMWRKHVDDCSGMIIDLHNHYRAGSLSMETNADKGYSGGNFEDAGMYVNAYHESTNKYIKIATYLRKEWKNIFWIADTDPEYLDQILDYTENATHDDAPDSAASLLREMETAVALNTNPKLRRRII